MRFTPWAAALSLCGAALLSACGGSSGSKNAHVRLINATQSFAALDLSVNDKSVNTGVAYAAAGSYADVDTGSTASKVLNSTTGQSVAATTPTLGQGNNYSIIAYGSGSTVRTALLGENETAPDANKAKLLVLNLASDAGAVDVYVTGTTDTLDLATPLTTGYNLLNSGTFRVRVTGSGKKSDLRLDLPSVKLDSASVNTLALLGSPSGVLVNAITVVQQGAVTNAANTLARVRALVSLPAGSAVQGTVNGTALLAASTTPAKSDYVSVAAGTGTVSFALDGTTITAPTKTLAAGTDYTLMVWGDAKAPKYVWLTDDNRLPATSGNVKMRMINGLSPAGPNLGMTVDLQSVASNVAAGAASDFVEIPSSQSSEVIVSVAGSLSNIFDKTGQTLVSNGVYTMYVLGGSASPVPLLLRDR